MPPVRLSEHETEAQTSSRRRDPYSKDCLGAAYRRIRFDIGKTPTYLPAEKGKQL